MTGQESPMRLPEAALRDLERIALRADALKPIVEAFPEIAAAADAPAASQVMLAKTGLEPLALADLLQGIEGILAFRETLETSPERAYELLTAGIAGSASEEWKAEKLPGWRRAAEQIIRLLDPDNPIAILSKANDLQYSDERVFSNGNIVTDVRPTFDSSGTTIKRAVVSHTLSIKYRTQRGGEGQFTVALDGADLDLLEALLLRAKQKANAIREQLTCWPVGLGNRPDV